MEFLFPTTVAGAIRPLVYVSSSAGALVLLKVSSECL